MTTPRITTGAVAICALVTWFGCSQSPDASQLPPAASQGGETVPVAPGDADSQSDEQILAILAAMHRTEIEHGQLAVERAQSPQVRDFASSIVHKHTASLEERTRIGTTNELTPEAGQVSRDLSARGAHSLQTLSSASAETFDQVYLELLVDQHREFLNWLNARLLPDVDNEALLHQLQAVRDSMEGDLIRAEKLVSLLPSRRARGG